MCGGEPRTVLCGGHRRLPRSCCSTDRIAFGDGLASVPGAEHVPNATLAASLSTHSGRIASRKETSRRENCPGHPQNPRTPKTL